ncbi:MAG: hypothetical protein AAGJ38_05040 [Planctomycetota bacterium]
MKSYIIFRYVSMCLLAVAYGIGIAQQHHNADATILFGCLAASIALYVVRFYWWAWVS